MQEQTTPQPVIAFTDLSIDEANAIFAALDQSELPHKIVTRLVAKLVAQANAQLNPAPAQSAQSAQDAQSAQSAQGAAEPPQTPAGENGETEVPAPGLSDPE
jgi:biotin carboxyl carrier protein